MSEVAPRHNPKLARWADLLTGGRILMALPLGVAGYGGNITATAVLLSLAWWSDFLDGRLARRAGGGTRLSGWDLGADTLVGAGLMTGLVAGGHILVPWGVAAALLGLGYIAFDNPSLGMLLQAIAYGSALWLAAGQATFGLVVAVATIAAITILSLPRLFGYLLPTFFRGLLGKVDKESDDGPEAR